MNPYWSYGLAAIGILGILLAGQKKAIGWAVGFGAQLAPCDLSMRDKKHMCGGYEDNPDAD